MAALSSLHHLSTSLSFLSRPSLSFTPFLRPIRFISPISSSSLQFNITFAPPKPKPKPKPPPNLKNDAVVDPESTSPLPANGQVFIPWIVRGEDGNLKLQAHPPASLINALADAKTQKPKKKVDKAVKKKKDEVSAGGNASVVPAKPLSKAARRFYNENFREPPQRLSKVLAAAGGKFTLVSKRK